MVAFEWVPYDQALIAASDPPAGAQTTAMVSIARSTTPPRWVQNKSNDCLSYLELVVDYSITTADGLLAEKVPVTLTEIKDVATGGGEAVLEPGQFGGTFTLSTAPGTNVRTILGLAVQKSTTFGGFLLRYDGPQANSVSQVILGRWPPDS